MFLENYIIVVFVSGMVCNSFMRRFCNHSKCYLHLFTRNILQAQDVLYSIIISNAMTEKLICKKGLIWPTIL